MLKKGASTRVEEKRSVALRAVRCLGHTPASLLHVVSAANVSSTQRCCSLLRCLCKLCEWLCTWALCCCEIILLNYGILLLNCVIMVLYCDRAFDEKLFKIISLSFLSVIIFIFIYLFFLVKTVSGNSSNLQWYESDRHSVVTVI